MRSVHSARSPARIFAAEVCEQTKPGLLFEQAQGQSRPCGRGAANIRRPSKQGIPHTEKNTSV